MKKEHVKKVKVFDEFVEVTKSAPEIYEITIYYADQYEEVFYRSFRDEDDAYEYCMETYSVTNDCIDCGCRFIKKVDFGGNEDE